MEPKSSHTRVKASQPREALVRQERLEQVIAQCMTRRAAGKGLPDAQVIADHPDLMPDLADELAKVRLIHDVAQRADRTSEVQADSLLPHSDVSLDPLSLSAGSVSNDFLDLVESVSDGELLPELPDYRIIRELSSGGQGVVYEAVQLSTKRTVALKLLLDSSASSYRARQRFEREIELVASLRHPNIVTIHESGITRGQYYYAMEYVQGQPLDTHIRLARFDVRAVVKLFITICNAVAYAHRQGVIHRDLKPSNILVDTNGDPVILDFGLARVLSSPDLPMLTMPGVLLGTIPYMAPEQTLGKPEGIDTRTDVYALGVILYELITGVPPYITRGVDLSKAFDNIRNEEASRPSKWCKQANGEIDAIILKAMEKDPARRYGSASEMSEDLTAWLEGRPVQARSASSLYVLRKLAFKHGFETLVILALIVAIGAFGAIAFQSQLSRWKALEQAARSDRATVDSNAEFAVLHLQNQLLNKHMTMGWFLAEWQAGRTARAAQLRTSLPADSPESIAMAFLLDESKSPEQLSAQLSAQEQPLAFFAMGERAYKQGQIQQAIQDFTACLQSPGSDWIKEPAQARLRQLGSSSGDRSGTGSAPAH